MENAPGAVCVVLRKVWGWVVDCDDEGGTLFAMPVVVLVLEPGLCVDVELELEAFP